MWICSNCETENIDDDDFCIECSRPKPSASNNHCSNPECKAYDVILPNSEQKYCGKCGYPTTYWKNLEDMC